MGKSDDIPEGFEGNLTKEQEEKLKEVWRIYFQVIKGDLDSGVGGIKAKKGAADDEEPKKKRGKGEDAFNDKSKDDKAKEEETKKREMKEAQDLLGSYKPEELRKAFWDGSRGETPDALMLRFLRARKWDINRAFAMAASVGRWRLEQDVEAIKRKGEEGLCKEDGFRLQYDSGKTYIQGTDKHDRPLVYIHVRKHRLGDQTQEAMERFTIFSIESAKSLLTPKCRGQGCIVFDLEGFGLMNMDWLCLRYLIEIFEARYPETLGVLLIHKAPYIALGIWKIVAPFLDPVVREKIMFVNSAADLEKYIDRKHIPKDMGGNMDWRWAYTGPIEGENSHMKDKKKRYEVMDDWEDAIEEFEDLTEKWINGDEEAGKERRDYGNKLIMTRFYDSDPWIRGQTVYSRNGTAVGDGRVKWKYPDHEEEFGTSYDEIRKEIGIKGECPKNGPKGGKVKEAQRALDAAKSPDEAAAFAAGKAGDDEAGRLKRRASHSLSVLTPGPSNAEVARQAAQSDKKRLEKDLAEAKKQEEKEKEAAEAKRKEAEEAQDKREAEQKKKDNSWLSSASSTASWASGAVFSTAAATAATASTFVPAALGGDRLREYTGAEPTGNDNTQKAESETKSPPKSKSKAPKQRTASEEEDEEDERERRRARASRPRRSRPSAPAKKTYVEEDEHGERYTLGKPSVPSDAVRSDKIKTFPGNTASYVPEFEVSNVNYDQEAEPPVHMFSDTS